MIENNKLIIAGIDDATKCPCIGSVFIAGVVADAKTIRSWKKAGVKDSKLITRKKRDKLAAMIKETALTWSVQEITPAMIDDKTINLNAWEMAVVLRVMSSLYTKSQYHQIYIDNWEVNESLFHERMRTISTYDFSQTSQNNYVVDNSMLSYIQIIAEHRADERYIVVGAASILAKHGSDGQYEQYKQQYGNFGSGSPADPATRLFVWQHRHDPPPIVRKSWNTYKHLAGLDDIENDYIYKRKNKIQAHL